jgi:hypothetical protein
VFDAFEERNEECWGEDGAEISPPPGAALELEKALAAAFRAWADKHGHPWRTWSLEQWRHVEVHTKSAGNADASGAASLPHTASA